MQGRKIIPAPRLDEGVKISTPIAVPVSDLPSPLELDQLREICHREYAAWTDSIGYVWGCVPDRESNEREYLRQFSSAIFVIQNLMVLPKPDPKRMVSAHIDMCTDQLRRLGKPGELRVAPLVLGCLIMGIPVSGLGISGSSISLGLSEFTGKPAVPRAWRAVLQVGKLPAQYPVERRLAPASPTQLNMIRPSVI